MKQGLSVFTLSLCWLCVSTAFPSSFVPGELLVKYREGRYPPHQQGELSKIGWAKIKINRNETLQESMDNLTGQSDILHVELNTYGQFLAEPNDPSFGLQWYLPAIEAPEAWDTSLGDGTIIGLVDSGVDLDHDDLAANILPGGWDFGDEDTDPGDELGHGTQVCGVIAAVQNNNLGISGVAPRSRILPLKINRGNADIFTDEAVAAAIMYAADYGVAIINLSLGWNDTAPHQLVADAITYAADKGVTLVAAAGNGRGPVWFPARLESVLAVSAIDRNDINEFSASGPELDLVAPGNGRTLSDFILTTSPGSVYTYTRGTSFSAAMVSGAAALLISEHPHFTANQIRKYLMGRADDLGIPGPDEVFGYGKVNISRTLDPLISFVFPSRIVGGRALPAVYLLALFGYDTLFLPLATRVSFASEHLVPLGPPFVVLPRLLLQLIMLRPDTPEGFIDLTVTTGTDTANGYDAFYITAPPRITDLRQELIQTN